MRRRAHQIKRGGPRMGPAKKRHAVEPWTDATEQLFMFSYEVAENPDWLVGSD